MGQMTDEAMGLVYCDCGNLILDGGTMCPRCCAQTWCDALEPWWLRMLRWLVR